MDRRGRVGCGHRSRLHIDWTRIVVWSTLGFFVVGLVGGAYIYANLTYPLGAGAEPVAPSATLKRPPKLPFSPLPGYGSY